MMNKNVDKIKGRLNQFVVFVVRDDRWMPGDARTMRFPNAV